QRRIAKFDLNLALRESPSSGLAGALEYATDLFDRATIDAFLRAFEILLGEIAADADQPVSSLQWLGKTEREKIVNGLKPALLDRPERCVHELFERQADSTPDHIAALFGADQITYGALDRRANQLAHMLREMGAGPEERIAICLNRGLEMAVAVLGVLKS